VKTHDKGEPGTHLWHSFTHDKGEPGTHFGGQGALRLLRRPGQHPGSVGVSLPRGDAMAEVAEAAEPAQPLEAEQHLEPRGCVAP
jgi:hypothetical protein